ncbi:glycosyl hydrolase family 18 protein [Cohnella terricola]|uniref:Glycosyl hydrolase n=1 Tax=Cohnella terricola TaxID=1289167 RepID=A0A559JXA3_9BACL|nr:glycosyl hydrolase family 18 protein [Cohnella terricola]TVY04513.1 glycosyl hydrolase [Cohnella terricola]
MNGLKAYNGRKRLFGLAAAGAIAVAATTLYLCRQDVFGAAVKPQITEHKTERSAWIADWRWEAGVADLEAVAGGLTSLQMFAAYFDPSDRLLITEDFRDALPQIREIAVRKELKELYLTLVNDIVFPDETASQKDPGLVSRLVADWSSRKRHIDEIVDIVDTIGLSGVELDYERVAENDWPHFVQLIRELQARLNTKGKSLRVVFEPRAPIEKLDLPEGPTYVMMAYNLYGGHSGPGPKADDAFIAKHAARMKKLPGSPYIALATGGFDWQLETGKAVGITEGQAAKLAERSSSAPLRDGSSGGLRFDYKDSNQAKHTVWYADGTTLAQWINAAKNAGIYNIAIWKLDELSPESLNQLRSSSSHYVE